MRFKCVGGSDETKTSSWRLVGAKILHWGGARRALCTADFHVEQKYLMGAET